MAPEICLIGSDERQSYYNVLGVVQMALARIPEVARNPGRGTAIAATSAIREAKTTENSDLRGL